MLFNVDQDLGNRISGYLATDSFSESGRIRVRSGGHEIAVVEAAETLTSLVVAGRHETGRCGFTLDETVIPGLRQIEALEILESETGLLIYRRAPRDWYIQQKLLRLETHMIPLRRLDRAVAPRFCYAYREAERAGLESSTQMFHLTHASSLYISGRLMYRTFEVLIDRGFGVACLIHDPFEELAERLLLLRQAARRGRGRLDMRDGLTFEAAIDFAATLPLDNDKLLRKAFGQLAEEAALPLMNPLTRQLTAQNIQDMPRSSSLATALTLLSNFKLVGLRSESEQFALALSALLGSDTDIVPIVPHCNAAIKLADRLRQLTIVQDLLGFDAELYERLAEAYAKAV